MHGSNALRCALGALAISLSIQDVTAQLTWRQIQTTQGPAPRWGHAVTRWGVTFGGRDANQAFRDTWIIRSTGGWQPMPTVQSPSARHGHAMDMSIHDTLMFGGADANGVRNAETWIFRTDWMNVPIGHPFTSSWTQLNPAHAPSPRAGHALAYDHQTSTTVLLFGGRTDAGLSDETWRFDGTDWQLLATSSTPPAREGHQLVPYRHDWLLFGGNDDTSTFDDAWQFDGVDWQQLPGMPVAVTEGAIVMLAFERRRHIFIGGEDGNGNLLSAVHERAPDGTWFAQPIAGSMPDRADATVSEEYVALTSFQKSMTAVVFGGRDAQGNALGDTWRLEPNNESDWEIVGSGCGPGAWSQNDGPNLSLRRVILGGEQTQGAVTRTLGTLTAIGMQLGQAAAPQPCEIAVQSQFVWAGVSDPTFGGFAVNLHIPFAEPLRGLTLSLQAVAVESGAPLGFALSRLGILRIGD
ncbi:MAG: hypothetical protein NXI31_01605 [bacterium]|nr:hypothetical protein [bacterium]